MAGIVVSGVRIAYRRRGSGPPLVLFHGAFEDSRVWAAEIDHLSAQVDVIAWDAPGCGQSDDVPAGWDDGDWAEAASGFIAGLGLKTAPAVAGFSLGSTLALLLARDHPHSLGRLVLVGAYAGWAGSLAPDELAQRIAATRFTIEHPPEDWAEGFLDSAFAAGVPPERRELARRMIDEWRPATTESLLGVMTQDLRPALRTIRTPTVVVRGMEDARSPLRAARELCELLPHARFVEIPGAGHDCTGPELDAVLVAAASGAEQDSGLDPDRV